MQILQINRIGDELGKIELGNHGGGRISSREACSSCIQAAQQTDCEYNERACKEPPVLSQVYLHATSPM